MVDANRYFKILVRWLIEGSRGGSTRARILILLKEKPLNPNQIAKELNLNYRTVMHHLDVLEKNGLISKFRKGYGTPYILSDETINHWNLIKTSIDRALEVEEE